MPATQADLLMVLGAMMDYQDRINTVLRTLLYEGGCTLVGPGGGGDGGGGPREFVRGGERPWRRVGVGGDAFVGHLYSVGKG